MPRLRDMSKPQQESAKQKKTRVDQNTKETSSLDCKLHDGAERMLDLAGSKPVT